MPRPYLRSPIGCCLPSLAAPLLAALLIAAWMILA